MTSRVDIAVGALLVRVFAGVAMAVALLSGQCLATTNLPTLMPLKAAAVDLTPEERAWLKANPHIRLAAVSDQPPYLTIDAQGKTVGIIPDIIHHLSRAIGQGIELQIPQDKKASLHDLAKGEGLYGTSSVFKTPQTEKLYLLTEAYTKTLFYIVTTREKQLAIKQAADLKGRKVAVPAGHHAVANFIKAAGGEVVSADTPLEQMQKVHAGEVDALIGYASYPHLMDRYLMTNLAIAFIAQSDQGIRIGVNPEHPLLHSILNKAVAGLDERAIDTIHAKWVQLAREETTPGDLTDNEKAWLAAGHKVRARISDYPPYMLTQPTPSGISVDLLNAAAKRFGFTVEYVPNTIGWTESMRDVREGRRHFDLLLAMPRTPEREVEFALTSDYLDMPWVIYTRKDSPFIGGLDQLEGKTVAAVKGFVITNKLKTDYPRVTILEVARSEDALRAVATGEADAYVGNLANSTYLIKELGFSNLVVAAPTPYENQSQAMAVRKDWPELSSLISKGFAAMSPEERNAIRERWMAVEVRPQIDYTLVWQVFAVAVLILLVFLYWNRRLSREIDRRKHVEAELRQARDAAEAAETRYRTVADFTYDWETWIDPQGNWLYCSPASAKISGHDAHEFMRTPGLFLEIAHPDDRHILERHMGEIEQGSRETEMISFRVVRSDGSIIWMEHVCQSVHDEQGRYLGRRGSNRDISERKRAEAELRQAKEASEAASRAKSIFLANMSHELRTPMHAIMGMTTLVLRRTEDPKLRDHLLRVEQASKHLLSVINDILDISKIEAERLVIEQTDFRLGAVIDNLQGVIAQKAAEKGIALAIDVPSDLAERMLLGDPLRLGQVLINLTGNAIKFTDAGSVNVRASLVEDSADGVLLRWEVQDTGIGIAPEVQARLFSAFEQADGTMTRKYGGTGLGLAISKRLVQLMGGEIGLESAPGAGSLFWFTVRLGRGRAAVPPVLTSEGPSVEQRIRAQHGGARVLLAEDEPTNQLVARALLEEAGLEVDLAEDGAAALALARQNEYDLILMDMQMPVMSGLEATRAIRANSLNMETPILAMTANAYEEDRQTCFAAGMDDFISKPVTMEVMQEAALRWLERQ